MGVRPFLIGARGTLKKIAIVLVFRDPENSHLIEKRRTIKKFARGTTGTKKFPQSGKK